MTDRLRELAESHGIQTRYRSETGERIEIQPSSSEMLLKLLGIDPETGEAGHFAEAQHEAEKACFLPEGLRTWGVTCQLYSLRSARNLGMGDYEDLARLAEIAGSVGADFLGVNPLHALFLANPGHCSPYSPSTRRFLNPLYIAVDRLAGGDEVIAELRAVEPELFEGLDEDQVDYPAVGRLKSRLLRAVFDKRRDEDEAAFARFRKTGGEDLRLFALFEAISADSAAKGGSAGWHGWPEELRDHRGEAVQSFAAANAEAVLFHQWLQFIADRQLAEAQLRAREAGMRIGLYLDFAVGVSPDGADTWTDPELTVAGARVGSPPDLFNSHGQDWGIAPLSPETLAARSYRPLHESYRALMQNAGAVRIDHAMGLARLWWIPEGVGANAGVYVRYPLGAMADAAASASTEMRCIVIGEDLGTIPEGFREAAETARILSYRVLYFEKNEKGFVAPDAYPERALACIATHDLATLAGWWAGSDIKLRAETGRQSEMATARDLKGRSEDKAALVRALAEERLAPPALLEASRAESAMAAEMDEELCAAVHRYGARSAAMLFAVQIEDMLLSRRQANLPGTMSEYPNWRIRLSVPLEDLVDDRRFQALARAMREERPETQ